MMQNSALKISPDGYIRLSFPSFSLLPFVHVFTERDANLQYELLEQTIFAELAGFSECISTTTPSISFGWAWYVQSESNSLQLAPEPVRSNVMIVDMQGYDVGVATTSELILQWLQYCDWQAMVKLALRVPLFIDQNRTWEKASPC